MKAILLSRVSTNRQDLEQQTNELIQEANRCGYKQYTIIENKESAISLDEEERQGLIKLKELINTGEYDCVICYEVSRLSRKQKVLYSIRDFLIDNKIQLIIIKPYVRLLDNDGKLSQTASIMFSLFSTLAESEMMVKKERMKRGKHHKQQLGYYVGGPLLYGYTTDSNNKIVLDEERAKVVKLVFNLYTEKNYSQGAIVKELIELGHITSTFYSGKVFVHKMLNNIGYTGELGNAKYQYPPIISKDTFNNARQIAQKNKNLPKHQDNNDWLLLGLLYLNKNNRLFLKNAGAKQYKCIYEDKDGVAHYYVMTTNQIEPIIWDIVKQYNIFNFTTNYDDVKKQLTEQINVATKKIKVANNKISDYQEQIDRIDRRIIEGKLSEAKGDKMLQEINDNIQGLKNNISQWMYEVEQYSNDIAKYTTDIPSLNDYTQYSTQQKKELIKSTITKITLMDKPSSCTFELDIEFKTGIIKTLKFNSRQKSNCYYLDNELYKF